MNDKIAAKISRVVVKQVVDKLPPEIISRLENSQREVEELEKKLKIATSTQMCLIEEVVGKYYDKFTGRKESMKNYEQSEKVESLGKEVEE